MDPVYAGTITGLVIVFLVLICSVTIWIYKEVRTARAARDTRYQRV